MNGLFSDRLSRKDQILLENLIFDMVDERIDSRVIIDDELVKRIKGHWLYRGFSISKEARALLSNLQDDELAEDWIEELFDSWAE